MVLGRYLDDNVLTSLLPTGIFNFTPSLSVLYAVNFPDMPLQLRWFGC
mgnify:CR=1 FL=1